MHSQKVALLLYTKYIKLKTTGQTGDRKKISLTAIEVKISNSPARRGKGVDKTKILKLDKKITTFLLSLSDLKI